MSRDYEARTLEAFYGFLEKGFVYRGLKPVYWCIHDRTALADAEIEYEQHTSPSVYVRYRLTSDPGDARPGAGRPRGLHHHLDDHSVDASRVAGRRLPSRLRLRRSGNSTGDNGSLGPDRVVAADLARQRSSLPACKLGEANGDCALQGRQAGTHRPSSTRSWTARILGVLATYVTADTGTGAVHTAPSHGADDFYTGQKYGLDLTCRVDAAGRIHVDPKRLAASPLRRLTTGKTVWAGQSHHRGHARGARRAAWLRPTCSTRIRTAGAATTRSSSAPPSSGSSALRRR